jgi:UDP-GlcNAc:undecaprenyl-phosphate GlcNAc-1-phosphate transferase
LAIVERLVLGLLLASAIAYAATPLAIALANRMRFFDVPTGYKAHGRPTPYLGGTAVMAGFVAAILLTAGDWHKTVPVVAGVALLWAVGTVDDRRTVSPWLRVVVELALAWLVWAIGLGWSLHMGAVLDLALTCLWVVGVINAFNLFDNMDGAASTMALAVSAGAAVLGVLRGDAWLAVGAASLGGACLGFLPRNLSLPARIFLGDGGSMPMGFVAAVLVMVAATTSVAPWQSLPVALLLVGIPALDTTLVVVSRRRRGVPVLAGGKDHLTHRTRRLLPGPRAVAVALGGVQAIVSVLAVLAAQGGASFVVLAAILYTLAALCAIAALERRPGERRMAALADVALEGGRGERPVAMPADLPVEPSPMRLRGPSAAAALLVLLGLGAGLSPFFFTYYDPSVWAPIGLGVVLLCAVGVVARPAVPSGPAALALAGLLGLGVWSLCSTAWTESVEGAVVTGNRWLAYGGLLLLLLVLVRSQRRAALLLAATGTGVAAVALSVLVRLLGHDPGALFLGGRLNEPLGYINGEGCLFAMGFWLCMAAAESRRALLAGPAAAAASLMASLALLSQSRGTALAMAIALVAAMALLPGRTRRAYALAVVAGGVALAGPALLHVYRSAGAGAVAAQAGHEAGRAALIAALAVGFAWAVLTGAWEALRAGGLRLSSARTAASWALLAPALAVLVLGLASARSMEAEASAQWRAFTHPGAPASLHPGSPVSSSEASSRLLSGAGNRYDYWRIAWGLWREHPLAGVGAGGYTRFYYRRRSTTEDVDQPHSLELQALSELGLMGGLLLLGFAGAVAWGAIRMRRVARASLLARATAVAATGSFAAWLAQASVDWMHLLPGLTAIAIAAAAALVWPRRGSSPEQAAGDPPATPARRRAAGIEPPPAKPRPWAGRRSPLAGGPALAVGASAVLVTVVVAGASLSRQALAQLYARRAQAELTTRPAAAVSDADRALDIDSDAVQTYYVKAAALARFDQAAAAEATLEQALRREPENFVTWGLLGDIAMREGRLAAARRDYRRAHALNPRNAALAALAVAGGSSRPAA